MCIFSNLRTGMWSTFLRVNKIASVLEGLNVTSHCSAHYDKSIRSWFMRPWILSKDIPIGCARMPLRPCHTTTYSTNVCRRVRNSASTLLYAEHVRNKFFNTLRTRYSKFVYVEIRRRGPTFCASIINLSVLFLYVRHTLDVRSRYKKR